jgi:pimeloyl-ACP methyl ester carboxylesterase
MLDPLILSALLSLAAPTALKDWKPCSADSALLCATLQVPLDYKSQKTIGVALIKYPAPKQPAKGSVLYVAGGPGSSGIQRVQSGGKELCERYLDNSMDLIGFDARGVGQTIPLKCFNSTEQYLALLNPKHGFSASMTSEEYALALAEEELTAQDCAAYSGGEYLNYTSTYYTARDMDEIRKFVGSEMMNSMGFSYGNFY